MILAHNMLAMNAGRQLNINNKSKNKALERLSTGYKINRAADDAAGLSISEEMRAQIRGLNRGSQNTEEGINMINTAEGGISEQIEILQRIRELTVQSYNDTNTQDDRLDIQMEVDALLEEIDRIAYDTEYNTIKVLQGKKITKTVEVVQPSEEYSQATYLVSSSKAFPSWVSYDAELKLNNTKVDSGNVQDVSEYVIFNEGQVVDPNSPQVARGPQPSQEAIIADGWTGAWSETLTDNYSAAIDFTEISTLTSKDDLYSHLNDLVGTGIGYECNTCERLQGVVFESDDVNVFNIRSLEHTEKQTDTSSGVDKDAQGLTVSKSSSDWGIVNLQEYYTQIDDLLEQSEYDALSPAEQAALGADYNTYVNDAAKAIAAGIVNKVTEATKFTDHFIRTLTDTSNPYQVVFYDYRDQDAPISKLDGDAWDTVELTLATQVMVKNNPMELTRYGEDDYWIQVAANSLQGVEIEFPDTRLEAIGMKDYTVFPEGYCSVTEDKKFDASALAGATKIGEHRYQGEVGGTPGVPVSTQYTVSGKRTVHDYEIVTEPAKRYTDRNGEKKVQPSKSYVNITGSHEESYSYTYTKTEYIGGTPGEMKEFYAYEPDTLLRVDRAISSLSESRSYLGAMTNRLEHAYLNDTNISENLQSAESRIRDTDMAEEAVALARDNILEQAGISMLAQANQMTQGVVELLR